MTLMQLFCRFGCLGLLFSLCQTSFAQEPPGHAYIESPTAPESQNQSCPTEEEILKSQRARVIVESLLSQTAAGFGDAPDILREIYNEYPKLVEPILVHSLNNVFPGNAPLISLASQLFLGSKDKGDPKLGHWTFGLLKNKIGSLLQSRNFGEVTPLAEQAIQLATQEKISFDQIGQLASDLLHSGRPDLSMMLASIGLQTLKKKKPNAFDSKSLKEWQNQVHQIETLGIQYRNFLDQAIATQQATPELWGAFASFVGQIPAINANKTFRNWMQASLPKQIVLPANGMLNSVAELEALTSDLSAQDAEIRQRLYEAGLEIGSLALDIAGVVDPSPVCNGLQLCVAISKKDWPGASLALISMLPYIGDSIVLPLKLQKYAGTIQKISRIARDVQYYSRLLNKTTRLEKDGTIVIQTDKLAAAMLERYLPSVPQKYPLDLLFAYFGNPFKEVKIPADTYEKARSQFTEFFRKRSARGFLCRMLEKAIGKSPKVLEQRNQEKEEYVLKHFRPEAHLIIKPYLDQLVAAPPQQETVSSYEMLGRTMTEAVDGRIQPPHPVPRLQRLPPVELQRLPPINE